MAKLKVVREILEDAEESPLVPLLSRIGTILVAESKKAFREQRGPDGKKWKRRYPNQRRAFINVALMLKRWGQGKGTIKRAFDNRPALLGSGELRRSINWKISGDEVVIGSSARYADQQQEGGPSTAIRITKRVKKKMSNFLRRNPEYQKQLGPLFRLQWYRTKINPRPFIGMSKRTEKKILEEIRLFFEGGGQQQRFQKFVKANT